VQIEAIGRSRSMMTQIDKGILEKKLDQYLISFALWFVIAFLLFGFEFLAGPIDPTYMLPFAILLYACSIMAFIYLTMALALLAVEKTLVSTSKEEEDAAWAALYNSMIIGKDRDV